ncbi:hypothetical protein ACN47E_004175 [Coniothyrium glycines]
MTDFLYPTDIARGAPFLALLGLATHYVLQKGEWDNSGHIVLGIWLASFGGIAASVHLYDTQTKTIGNTIRVTAVAGLIYFGTLTTSILIYRGFFHRTRRIPGPFLARFSKLHSVFAGVLPDFQYFRYTEKLYNEYKQDVIRTGPREVTIYCADAVPLVHGAMSRCTKGTWYSFGEHIGGKSTQTTRSKEEHKRRRKAWDHALSTKSLRDYEPRLNRHSLALMTRLRAEAKQPSVRYTNWVNFYSFDVMGDVAFNRSFGMLEKGEEADVIKLLHASMEPLSIFGHLTWGLNLITRTPAGAKALLDHIEWTANCLAERKKITPKENDIFSWILDPNEEKVSSNLNADARLAVVAGSDTTASTLAWIAYELCKNPDAQRKAREAVELACPKKTHLDVEDIANIPILDGVINEAMRLHPAVPSGVQRETPPEGITLPNGTYIPGNVIIWMPIHCIQRDPRYFQKPLQFMPERWTDEQPQAVIDKRAFMPFNVGAYNCVGQKLAMLELRSVTANLLKLFDISFAAGEDGSTIETKSRDCFTTNVGKLDVKLTPRYKD